MSPVIITSTKEEFQIPESRISVPAGIDVDDLASDVIQALSMWLPDANSHRARCREVVKCVLRERMGA